MNTMFGHYVMLSLACSNTIHPTFWSPQAIPVAPPPIPAGRLPGAATPRPKASPDTWLWLWVVGWLVGRGWRPRLAHVHFEEALLHVLPRIREVSEAHWNQSWLNVVQFATHRL